MKKKQQQILVMLIGGFVLFLFIYYKLLLSPINKGISEKIKLIDEKSKKLQKAILLAESLPLLKQETQILELQIAELEKKLPTKPNIPELIKIIGKVSQAYNIKISNITTKSIDTSAEKYSEIPFSISFTANYHSLGQFLTNIAQEKRIFAVKDLVMTYTPTTSKDNYLNVNCIIFSYALK
ncbi:MAG: type 4a pilus biogenesis protein PilO [Elusimicrobiota bacterium]|nr:type 4a pilus biogenesis protein PilO [Endomicrobiia bacterium]MCX7910397.1 type 4a pilus biogenesis protein PilO [Endomicrobiia bacterium]MDW8166316.1 type 4a pilus biogenesis protein PilO [Elusimicrobiota bacterium]